MDRSQARLRAVICIAVSILTVGAAAVPALGARKDPAGQTVRDRAPGVARVILWGGVDDALLNRIREVSPYALVYRYEVIEGAAVAVPRENVDTVIRWAKAQGVQAKPDRVVKVNLAQSTRAIHVKGTNRMWDQGYTGRGVSIAVIDTGIRATHKSLDDIDDDPSTPDPKVVAFRDYVNNSGNPATPYDDQGHGSHVSGIAAGTGDGSFDNTGPRNHAYVGAAYEASLVGLKVLNANGLGSSSNIIAAINWVANNANSVSPPIRVVNISLGSVVNDGSNNGTDPEDVAVNNASALGITFAIAAGNGTTDGLTPNLTPGNVSIPGDAESAITVCSSDSTETPPGQPAFSNWDSEGPTADGRQKPDVCAPGESVRSVGTSSDTAYTNMGGTSMASPHIAGVAALLIQALPHLTPAQVKKSLIATASHAGSWNADSGWGEAYAKEALDYARANFGSSAPPLFARANGPYYVPRGESRRLTASVQGGVPPYAFAWDLNNDGVYGGAGETGQTVAFTNTAANGTFSARLRVTDSAPTPAVSTDVATVQVLDPIVGFFDNVEDPSGNGWVATSQGSATAPGWRRTTIRAKSPTNSWYVGTGTMDASAYTPNEDVWLTRSFDLSSPAVVPPTSAALIFKFFLAGDFEKGFDFLHLKIREGTTGPWTELARYDDTQRTVFAPKTLDLTAYKGKQVQIAFNFTSDEINPPADATATGPFVDDISLIGTAAPVVDTTPPAPITDLAAGAPITATSVRLSWTATGNDGTAGTAASYDLRRATSPIDASNFALATRVATGTPQPSGAAESTVATGLAPNTRYWFAIVAADGSNNVSSLSNIPTATTLADLTPPSQVTGLTGSPRSAKALLSWNAATDDSGIDHYVVYQNDVDVLHTTERNAEISGLTNGVTYSFAVSAVDTAGNEGPRSVAVLVTPKAPTVIAGWPQTRGGAARTGESRGTAAIPIPHVVQTIQPGGVMTQSPLIADLDRDGLLDVVTVANAAAGERIPVKAFKQTASGLQPLWTFLVPTALANTTNGVGSIAVGDLDGDATPEVAVYTNYSVQAGVSTNEGRLTVLNGATGAPLGVLDNTVVIIGQATPPVIGDVDGDESPEIVLVRRTGGTDGGYYLMSAKLAAGGLVKGFDTKIGTNPILAAPALAELRAAHPGLEVVLGENGSTGTVWVCKPTPGSPVCNESVNTNTFIRGVSVANLDSSPEPEIVLNAERGASLQVVKTAPALSAVSRSDGYLWNTATLGDVDGDGRADIVNVQVSSYADDTAKRGDVQVRGFDGTAITDKGTLVRTPSPGSSKQSRGGGALMDVAGDPRPELVFGSDDSSLVAVSFSATGAPSQLWSVALPAQPSTPVAIGDVDGDGHPDLVVATTDGRVAVVGNREPVLGAIGDRAVAETATLSFTLSANDPDGDTITFSGSNLPSGSTLTGATFSWTPTNDQAGTYPNVRFTASDGGYSVSRDITITVTNVPRAPSISAPTEGAILASSTVTVSGAAEPGTTVRVLEGGVGRGSATADGTGAWSAAIAFAEGSHAITADANDGTTTGPASAARTFSVDITAPAAPSFTAPAQGSSTNASPVRVAGTAETGSTVEVLRGGVSQGTAQATGGSWSMDLALPEGPMTLTATATDAAGNVSASASRSFTVDRTAPAAPVINDPADGAVLGSSSVALAGTAEPGSTVQVLDGTTQVATAAAGPSGDWTAAATLAEGSHTLTATATDAATNVSAASAAVRITVDLTAPGAPVITSPVAGAATNAATVDVTGTAEPGSLVTVREGVVTIGSATTAGDGRWTVSYAFAEGSHTLGAKATDAAGNVSAESSRTFVVDRTAPAAPVVSSPAPGALLSSASVTVSGTAEPGSTVTVREGSILIGQTTASGGSWSVSGTFADGPHALTITATDAAGNTSAASARSFTVDTTPPAAPVVNAPAEGALLASSLVAFAGTGEPGATVTLRKGTTVLATAAVNGFGDWTASATLADGVHAVTATATDPAGNISAASGARTFTVDTTPPAAPVITSPAADATVGATLVNIAGTAEPNATVRVLEGATLKATSTASGTGSWTAQATFPDGTHTITATATDAAGNVSPATVRTFAVNATPPAVPTVVFEDGGDGRITQTESSAVILAGGRPADTTLRITISDQVASTPDVVLTLGRGTGAYRAGPADLSGLALGELRATAVAFNTAGHASQAAVAVTRKVPDAGGPVAPRVEIRDGDGVVSAQGDDVTRVPVTVTNLSPSPATVRLLVSDGNAEHDRTFTLASLGVDTPTDVIVDFSGFDDGTVRATATLDGTTLASTDTTVLDLKAPKSTWGSSTSSTCFVIPLINATNCALTGSSKDAATGIQFVYVTGRNSSDGARFSRTAIMDAAGAKESTWRIASSALAGLTPGTWIFVAQAQDASGNFEAPNSNSVTVTVL